MFKSSIESTITHAEKNNPLHSTFAMKLSSYQPILKTGSDHLPSDLYSSCLPCTHEEHILPHLEDDFPLPKSLKKIVGPDKI